MLRTGPARVLGLQEIITADLETGGDLWVENGQMGGRMDVDGWMEGWMWMDGWINR